MTDTSAVHIESHPNSGSPLPKSNDTLSQVHIPPLQSRVPEPSSTPTVSPNQPTRPLSSTDPQSVPTPLSSQSNSVHSTIHQPVATAPSPPPPHKPLVVIPTTTQSQPDTTTTTTTTPIAHHLVPNLQDAPSSTLRDSHDALCKQVVLDASAPTVSSSAPVSTSIVPTTPPHSDLPVTAQTNANHQSSESPKQHSPSAHANPALKSHLSPKLESHSQQPESHALPQAATPADHVQRVASHTALNPVAPRENAGSKLDSSASVSGTPPQTSPPPTSEKRDPRSADLATLPLLGAETGQNVGHDTLPQESHIANLPQPSDNSPPQLQTGDGSGGDGSATEARGPPPKVLPKTAKNRPENARVFIGNLASEYTNVNDIIAVFHRYGELIEEPVLRRSFGFVQYSSAEAAKRAVAAEQGRIIGGIGIDLSIADNREVRKGMHVANNTPFSHPLPKPTRQVRREREFGMPNAERARKRRRSLSPASAAKKGGVHPPQFRRVRPDPKNGVYLRILCMSPTAKAYARHCEATFRNMTGLHADVLHIVAAGLGEALGRAMRDIIPYVMVVASKDVEDGTCTIRTLEKTGYEKSGRGNGVIPLREAVEVCLIERGVISPQNAAPHQNMGPPSIGAPALPPGGMGRGGPMGSMNHYGGSGGGRQVIEHHGMNSGGHSSQWGGPASSHMGNPPPPKAKPAWMTGPRVPHPANTRVGAASMGHPIHQQPQGMGSVMGSSGYGYNAGMDARGGYGHAGPGAMMPTNAPPPRAESEYGRGPPPPVPPSVPQHSYDARQGIGPVQSMGGDYMRGPGGNMNPPGGINPLGGYMDRYEASSVHQRGNPQYGSRTNNRESEYDPTAVMPSQSRGPDHVFANNSSWGRDGAPLSRPEMYGERIQPAVARDRSGGFQTVGGGPQIYPGGSGSGNSSSYSYDRPQNQGPRAPVHQQQYMPVNTGVYDPRQNTYAGNAYEQPQQQQQQQQQPQQQPQQYVGGGMIGLPGDGDRYGGMYSQPQQPQQPAMSQRFDGNVAVYGNAELGRNVGWNEGGRDQGNTMGMHGGNMGGMSSGTIGGPIGGYGQNVMPNSYAIHDDRGSGNSYMGRSGGDVRGKESSRGENRGNVLGTGAGTVDINKLTTLISAFQQRAQQQQQNVRGVQGMPPRQQAYPPQPYADRNQRIGGPPQQRYYR